MSAPGSAEWHADRQKGIGASEVKDLLDLKPYGCRRKLVYSKTVEPDFPPLENQYMKRGHDLEDAVARTWEAERGMKMRRVLDADAIGNAKGKELRAEYPFLRANLDRQALTDEDGPMALEIKTLSNARMKRLRRGGVDEDGEFADWWSQVQWQLAYTGWDYGEIAAIEPNEWKLESYSVERDDGFINVALRIGRCVWANVEVARASEGFTEFSETTCPRLEVKDPRCRECDFRVRCHGDAWFDAMKLSTDPDADMGDFSDSIDWAELSEHYRSWKLREDELKEEGEGIKEAIRCAVGDRGGAQGHGLRVYYKEREGAWRIDSAALKKAHPAIYDVFRKQNKASRPLRIYLV